MNKLGFVGIAIAALAVSGCGGGASTPATPAATATSTPAAPGTLAVAYSSAANFGVSGAAPNPLAFTAPTETATLTATQANYSGSFGAAVSTGCTAVTVAPATSTTGVFTATAVAPVTTGCTITVTGATGTTAVAFAASVPTPGGTVLRWYTPNYATQSPPLAIAAGPINLVGLGATFASVLAISEQNYIGGFTAANIVATGCGGFATSTADATVPTGLPTAAPGTSLVYYTITGVAAVNTTAGCTITATDSQTTPTAASIGVSITTVTGTFQ